MTENDPKAENKDEKEDDSKDKLSEKEEIRAKIRELKAELKNIANQMVRARTIGEQSNLKNDQKATQREILKLQTRLKRL